MSAQHPTVTSSKGLEWIEWASIVLRRVEVGGLTPISVEIDHQGALVVCANEDNVPFFLARLDDAWTYQNETTGTPVIVVLEDFVRYELELQWESTKAAWTAGYEQREAEALVQLARGDA
jgi:hypothetical protein